MQFGEQLIASGLVDMPKTDATRLRPVPAHVPPELVRPYPYVLGAKSKVRPHDFIADIHAGPAIFWAERAHSGADGAWIPRRFEDMQVIFKDIEHFSNGSIASFHEEKSWHLIPGEADPPLHALYRAMANPEFTVKRIVVLEHKIRDYARQAVAGFRDRGRCEFMKDFAFEFPIKVFLDLMGLRHDRIEEFLLWEHNLIYEADRGKIEHAVAAIASFLREEIELRRKNPGDDLISYGIKAQIDGRKLSDNELVGFCFNLYAGGLDTVSNNLGWQFLHLAERIDHQKMLRANPEAIPDAIEEMLRFYAPVTISRVCKKDTVLNGVSMKVGDRVMLNTFLAGHDPEIYTDPEAMIFDRRARHLSFGYGPHLCLGMHLARRELRIALEEFLSQVPQFRLAAQDVKYYLGALLQPVEFEIVWNS